MEAGILTSNQENQLAILLADTIKLKGIWGMLDGFVFKAVITFADNTYADKLAVDLKTKLAAIITAVMENNPDLAESLSADLITQLITIPGIDKEAEGLVLKGLLQIFVGAVVNWINHSKGTKVTLNIK
jgi:phage tail protein X